MTRLDLTFTVPDPPAAAFAAGDTAARTIAGLAVPLGVPSGPSADGHRYRFTAPPDNAADLVDVVAEHDDDALVGRLAEPFDVTDTGVSAVARIFGTTRGNDVLVEAAEGARTGFSISAAFADFTEAADGIRDVAAWTVRHLGIVRRPAFAQSAGLTINASATTETPTTTGEPTMTDPTTTPPAVADLGTPPETMPTVAELAALVADQLQPVTPEAHPLARFGSFAEFCAGVQAAPEDEGAALLAAFAVPDQVTGDNPGVMPPSWRTDIKANLDRRRPAIRATGGPIGLPPTGMDANWPYFAGTLDGIIAQQTTEKASLAGIKLSIKKATAPIKTAGTVSDISYQLLMRSSPSYLAAYLNICQAAWARYTEKQFEAALVAGGTDAGAALDTSTGDKFAAQLFAASAAVEDATGSPAAVALVDSATFTTLGGLADLRNGKYGTQNVAGTSSAATLRIDVNGLPIVRAPFLPAATMVVTNEDAARFAESGPRVASQEDVTKLGRDVAVWGMYEDAEIYFAAGVQVYAPQG